MDLDATCQHQVPKLVFYVDNILEFPMNFREIRKKKKQYPLDKYCEKYTVSQKSMLKSTAMMRRMIMSTHSTLVTVDN